MRTKSRGEDEEVWSCRCVLYLGVHAGDCYRPFIWPFKEVS